MEIAAYLSSSQKHYPTKIPQKRPPVLRGPAQDIYGVNIHTSGIISLTQFIKCIGGRARMGRRQGVNAKSDVQGNRFHYIDLQYHDVAVWQLAVLCNL